MSKAINFVKGFWKRYRKAKINVLASSLAFYSLTSILPMFTLGFWYLTTVGVTEKWLHIARGYIVSHLDFGSGESVLDAFNKVTAASAGSSWGWIGLFTFFYIAIMLLISIGNALDHVVNASEIEMDLSHGTLMAIGRRFIFLVFMPIALLISSLLMSWIKDDSWMRYVFKLHYLGSFLALPLPWSLDLLVFVLLYLYVPNRKVTPRQALRAALFSTPLYIAGKHAMGYYSAYALTTHKIYGAFAVIPLMMLWIYVAWMIVLTGALFIRESAGTMARTTSPASSPKSAS
ncbi:MAG: YihY/virulence factor BrkB family protein [Bdellovibrionota bacterium]